MRTASQILLSLLAVIAVYSLVSVFHFSYCSTPLQSQPSLDHQHHHDDHSMKSPIMIQDQAYVVSMTMHNSYIFQQRNTKIFSRDKNNSVVWFPAFNGLQQSVLDDYATLTGFRALNASNFGPNSREIKFYETPHHVGCFMSHWHLLRLALSNWATSNTRPKALWIMEDDAVCATNTSEDIQRILPTLPDDWDLFFFGGKPFSYHTIDPVAPIISSKKTIGKEFDDDPEFRELA